MASDPGITDPSEAHAMLLAMAISLGREINVYMSRAVLLPTEANPTGFARVDEEPEDFYEFTQEDYARLMANKKEEIFLKTKKIREAEAAARRARITKAIIRVQFPDNFVLEAKFQPFDTISMLIELLKKVVKRPDLPFYLYTTPPKQQLIDLEKDFYTAGLTPGALVYFSYELPKGATKEVIQEITEGPFLIDEVMALRDLHLLPVPISEATEKLEQAVEKEQIIQSTPLEPSNSRPRKTGVKPKWMKL